MGVLCGEPVELVAEYWIVNLADRVLEVLRDPAPDPRASHRSRYRTVEHLAPGALVSLLALPAASVRVADLFP
jgi:Uma2 family endonuclease